MLIVKDTSPRPPFVSRKPVVELLAPCFSHTFGTKQAAVRDTLTGRVAHVEARGMALWGSLLCARLGAVEVDGDLFIVADRLGRMIHVEPAEGSPLQVLA